MNDRRFESLVRSHIGAVTAYANALMGNRHLADEAVQETLVRAWKYLDTYDSRGSFQGWLITICRNCVLDLQRRETIHETRTLDVAGETAPDTTHDLITCLAQLPVEQREVVVVNAILGYDYQDTAQLLGLPIGTVRSRLSRGRALMTKILAEASVADEETA